MKRFHGTLCRHFTIPNSSGATRVSIDFRCAPLQCFDPTYVPTLKTPLIQSTLQHAILNTT